jgi:hypothetical protein
MWTPSINAEQVEPFASARARAEADISTRTRIDHKYTCSSGRLCPTMSALFQGWGTRLALSMATSLPSRPPLRSREQPILLSRAGFRRQKQTLVRIARRWALACSVGRSDEAGMVHEPPDTACSGTVIYANNQTISWSALQSPALSRAITGVMSGRLSISSLATIPVPGGPTNTAPVSLPSAMTNRR